MVKFKRGLISILTGLLITTFVLPVSAYNNAPGNLNITRINSMKDIPKSTYRLVYPQTLDKAKITSDMSVEVIKETGTNSENYIMDSHKDVPTHWPKFQMLAIKMTPDDFKKPTYRTKTVTLRWNNLLQDKDGNMYDYQLTHYPKTLNMSNVQWKYKPEYLNYKYLKPSLLFSYDGVGSYPNVYQTARINGVDPADMIKSSAKTLPPHDKMYRQELLMDDDTYFGTSVESRYMDIKIFKAGTNELSNLANTSVITDLGSGGGGEGVAFMSGYGDAMLLKESPIKSRGNGWVAGTGYNGNAYHPNPWANNIYVDTQSHFSLKYLNSSSAGFGTIPEYRLTAVTDGNGDVLVTELGKDYNITNKTTLEENSAAGYIAHKWDKDIKIKPKKGYRIKEVKINGKSYGDKSKISLKEITENVKVEATFQKDFGSIKINKSVNFK